MKKNYSRRDFLKTVVVTAGTVGSAGSLVGCGGDSSDSVSIVQPTSTDTNGVTFPQSVASGDPRSGSIVLWTRVEDFGGSTNLSVAVQVAEDSAFEKIIAQQILSATDAHDYCVKAKVTNLTSGTTYYYRFIYSGTASKTGRFKTSPSNSVSQPVKLAYVSCQDFTNGYYNTLLKLLETGNDDIDFVVHLGDYIYETTGDPSFQSNVRSVTFTDTAGAIERTAADGSTVFYAAKSVSNYRDLYKTYRGDQLLKELHEKFAFIVIWDDHEFSDDCWQDTANYFGGTVEEKDTDRRKNAEQAFFEYMPIDMDLTDGGLLANGQVDVNRDDLFSGNTSIYRSFRYGSMLNLMMTDFRSFRPDHVIPEDGYPGTIVMDKLDVGKTLYATPGDPFGAKAGTDAALSANFGITFDSSAAGFSWSDIQLPSATTPPESYTTNNYIALTLAGVTASAVASGALPIHSYIDIGANTELNEFMLAFNSALALLGQTQFSGSAQPTTQELLIASATQAYADPSLGQVSIPLDLASAQAKAISVVTGNLDVDVVNASLNAAYGSLMLGLNAVFAASPSAVEFMQAPFTDLDTMFGTLAVALQLSALAGQREVSQSTSFGVSWALMGKTTFASSFGSRYLVVKDTYDLFNLYQALVLATPGFGLPYGSSQQTTILVNQNTSQAVWNVLGSSVSYTSLILDAKNGTLGATLDAVGVPSTTFPRVSYYMNVDHMDGFPLTRATYMNDASGALAANRFGSFQDTNTVIISGDIHANFITDHGAGTAGGHCVEFTTTGVSSGTFGSFTGTSIAGILDLDPSDPTGATIIGNFTQGLSTFLKEGVARNTASPQEIVYANPLMHGVGVMTITEAKLTSTFYLLDTTSDSSLLTTSLYGTDSSTLNWKTIEGVVTKTDGQNSAPVVTES